MPVIPPDQAGVEQSERVVRGASIASAAVAVSRVSGLVRESFMGRVFGAGMEYDAFVIGFRIPNLTRDLFAEGALSSAFVPTFVDYLHSKSKQEAAHLARLVGTAIVIIVGLVCVLGIAVSPWLVGLITRGWVNASPEKYALAVHLTQVMFPFLLLVALAAQAMGVLNAVGQFGIPALSSTFFNIGSVGAGVVLGFFAGPHIGLSKIEGMAWGVVCGGALQLLVQLPSLIRAGFRFWPAVDWSHPGLRHILKLMGPAILGNAAVQVNVMVNSFFATSIHDPVRGLDGPVSWLGFAFRFMQLPLGLFGVAIATATLPSIGRSATTGDIDEFRDTLARSLGLVFLLTVPSAAGLMLLGPSIVGAIYEGSSFKPYDTQQTAVALACYSVGLAGYAAIKVLTPAFYALKDSRTPMFTSLASIAINIVMAIALVQGAGLGHAGLALSTSVVALANFFVLFWIMRARIGGVYGRRLRDSVLKVLAATGAMSAVVWFSSAGIHLLLAHRIAAHFADLLVSIPLGLAALYLASRALRIEELELATRALAGPIARRLSRLNAKLGG